MSDSNVRQKINFNFVSKVLGLLCILVLKK